MTMVSVGVDGLGEADGPPDGPPDGLVDGVGDGLLDGAGVSSGGPASIDGAAVGGVVGTWPSPPDGEHAAVTRTRLASASVERTDR
jgi:hypothetical protein